jgi:hypothetical protein
LSQCFLFMASKISDKCSNTDLGESPPEQNIWCLSIYEGRFIVTRQKTDTLHSVWCIMNHLRIICACRQINNTATKHCDF